MSLTIGGEEEIEVLDSEPIRVVVVEDEPLYRDLLHTSLDRAGFEVAGAFADAESALLHVPALAPEVAVLDIELGSSINGIEVGIRLRRLIPTIGIVLLSNYRSPALVAALPTDVAGGWSYLSKRTVSDVDALSRAITGAADGLVVFDAALTRASSIRANSPLVRLSHRQREIVRLIAQGYSNKAISEHLILTEKSVENHVTRIFQIVDIDAHHPAIQQRVQITLLYIEGMDSASSGQARHRMRYPQDAQGVRQR